MQFASDYHLSVCRVLSSKTHALISYKRFGSESSNSFPATHLSVSLESLNGPISHSILCHFGGFFVNLLQEAGQLSIVSRCSGFENALHHVLSVLVDLVLDIVEVARQVFLIPGKASSIVVEATAI